jgi:scyllo-inositol 2-dehydrogenase (NADP+)
MPLVKREPSAPYSPAPMTEKIKVALIGLGGVAVKRNLPVLKKRPEYEVVGVIDRNEERAASVAKRFGLPHFERADSLDGISWLDEVSLIGVGTGPQSHHALISSALALGKDVLTEKPFTMTVAEGEELVAQARAGGRILGIVHNFQFASSTLKLLRDIESGRLGRIKSIVARQFSNPRRKLPAWYDELPLGLFYDESPHFFYLVERIAPGPLTFLAADVFPSTTGRETPAYVDVAYRCESPRHGTLPVTVEMNFETGLSEWHLTVFGEDGLGDIDLFRDIYIHLPNDGEHTTATVIRTTTMATAQHWGQTATRGALHLTGKLRYGVDEVLDLFTAALISRTEPEGIGADDALEVLKLQHQVLESHRVL